MDIYTTHCPVLGTEFTKGRDNTARTLDRVDPSGGYVQGNVAFISHRANRIKYDASVEELKAILEWYQGATTSP